MTSNKAPPGQRSGSGFASILEHVNLGLSRPGRAENVFDRSGHTVLVVDDVPAQRYSTERMVRAGGYRTLEAETGHDAVNLASQVSAIILDVNLPDVHGIDVCTTLRSRKATATTPIILTSAVYVDDLHRDAGLQALADAYLIAPLDPDALRALLDRLIQERSPAA
ncbi:MAG TPA: response regulator [Ramlibacter sp.]|jgi:CheY-like chemotaxis protein|uniref:response regulator n=1 Tax=Ramlibacter sp. TaxID=1917967 RepID=UPI002D4F0593|nr:response regulator [Ramlibacter sp.]HZY18985.1 response regulator [Ramlibacter sp.]